MSITWKHAALAALGASLPALVAGLESQPVLTWPVASHMLAAGLVTFVAALVKGAFPEASK